MYLDADLTVASGTVAKCIPTVLLASLAPGPTWVAASVRSLAEFDDSKDIMALA